MENICCHVPPRVENGKKRKRAGCQKSRLHSMCGVGWGVEMRGCGQTWGPGEWCLLGSRSFSLPWGAAVPRPPSSGGMAKKRPSPAVASSRLPPSHPSPSVVGTSSSLQALLHARVLLLLILLPNITAKNRQSRFWGIGLLLPISPFFLLTGAGWIGLWSRNNTRLARRRAPSWSVRVHLSMA